VPVLAARDAERVLRFVAEAEELVDDDPFPPGVLQALGRLVEADGVGYCEQDRVRKRVRLSVDRPGDDWSEPSVEYWDIADEHPVCRRRNAGDFEPLMLSDFLSQRELHRSRIYDLWFRPLGVERELTVPVPSPPWHTKTFLFHRRNGSDFTERDRLVLDLLQPHFTRLWRAAQTRRRLRAAVACLERAGERELHGVVFLGAAPHVDFVSPPAARMLRDYFAAQPDGSLPPALVRWLESGKERFTRRCGSRMLTVDRAGDTLMLEESGDELGLTRRELQILAWVARGKSNVEVAETLWIAPSTVRKHLEHIYGKLGVRTRTAAVARFFESQGA
jgi:DNA-binding CsgD family transcriptional regulator